MGATKGAKRKAKKKTHRAKARKAAARNRKAAVLGDTIQVPEKAAAMIRASQRRVDEAFTEFKGQVSMCQASLGVPDGWEFSPQAMTFSRPVDPRKSDWTPAKKAV